MYTRFGFFPVSPFSGLLDGGDCGKVDDGQYLRSTFIFVTRRSRYSRIYVSGQSAALPTTLHPTFNTSIVQRSHAKLLCTWDGERDREARKAKEREKERPREKDGRRRECTGEMCNKRIAGQRSRTGPGLFEDDLKISLYEA